jgi:uncharacterized surface protein with fasciclin (FAS1) repeats
MSVSVAGNNVRFRISNTKDFLMRSRTSFWIAVVTTCLFVAGCADKTSTPPSEGGAAESATSTGEASTAGETEKPAGEVVDIVDTAVAADGFDTLVAAVKAAELVDTLKGQGPFTVFAPTDDAFGKLPEGTLDDLLKPDNKDKLTSILTYHVVPGKVMAADVVNLTSATTVQGADVAIAVDGDKVTVNGANVTATDIECSNGVIHVIDAVILPPETKETP